MLWDNLLRCESVRRKKLITLHPVVVAKLPQTHLWHSRKGEVAQGQNCPRSPLAACMLCLLQVPSCMSAERIIYVQMAKPLLNSLWQLHVLVPSSVGAGLRA